LNKKTRKGGEGKRIKKDSIRNLSRAHGEPRERQGKGYKVPKRRERGGKNKGGCQEKKGPEVDVEKRVTSLNWKKRKKRGWGRGLDPIANLG